MSTRFQVNHNVNLVNCRCIERAWTLRTRWIIRWSAGTHPKPERQIFFPIDARGRRPAKPLPRRMGQHWIHASVRYRITRT